VRLSEVCESELWAHLWFPTRTEKDIRQWSATWLCILATVSSGHPKRHKKVTAGCAGELVRKDHHCTTACGRRTLMIPCTSIVHVTSRRPSLVTAVNETEGHAGVGLTGVRPSQVRIRLRELAARTPGTGVIA